MTDARLKATGAPAKTTDAPAQTGRQGTPQPPRTAESTPTSSPRRRYARFFWFLSRYGTIVALAIMIVVFSIANPESFLTINNLVNVLNQSSLTALIACGLTVALIVGEFDLSIGFMASLAGVLVAGLMTGSELPVAVAVIAVLCVGAFIGAVNGVLVAKARINAVIATLGIGTVLVGVSYTYNSGAPTVGLPSSFLKLALGRVAGIPNPVIIVGVIALFMWVIINRTEFGQRLQAVGGNPEAARLTGISVDKVRILAFVTSGICAAATGIMLSSLIGSGTLEAGDAYLLPAFASVFLGSATLRAGEFHIWGTVIGVVIINTGINGLSIFGAPTSYQDILTGSILVLAVGLSTVARRYAQE